MMTVSEILEKLKYQFKYGGIVVQLIFINVILYFIFSLLSVIGNQFLIQPLQFFNLLLTEWLYLPSSLGKLIYRPYTFITYQFLHADFWHIFFNMLVLFYFGKILSMFMDKRKILPLYLMGGIAGGILFILLFNILPAYRGLSIPLVGASASIMAIVAAAAMLAPDMEVRLFFTLRVPLKYVAIGLAVVNFISMNEGNTGGKIAHIGGLAFGVLFVYLLKNKGIDLARPFNRVFDWIVTFLNKPKPPKVVFTTTKTNKPPIKKEEKTVSDQSKTNAILDKISANGYESLTQAEKEFLFTMSKKD